MGVLVAEGTGERGGNRDPGRVGGSNERSEVTSAFKSMGPAGSPSLMMHSFKRFLITTTLVRAT